MLLSICIPTYNRKEPLTKLLAFLAEELCEGVEVVIIDNASDYSPEDVPAIKSVLDSGKSFRIIRNCSNVGAGANVMRCFENAKGQWVWILGDDDLPAVGAIKTVVPILLESTEIQGFNFASSILSHRGIYRGEIVPASGILDFAEKVDCFSNLLFISATIYRRKRMIPHLRVGYYMLDSCAPHLAMLFSAIQLHKDSVVFHPYQLVHWEANDTDNWDIKIVCPKLRKLFSVIKNEKARQILAAKNADIHRLEPFQIEWRPRYLIKRALLDDQDIYHYLINLIENFNSLLIDNGRNSPRLLGSFCLEIISLILHEIIKTPIKFLFNFLTKTSIISNYEINLNEKSPPERKLIIDDKRL